MNNQFEQPFPGDDKYEIFVLAIGLGKSEVRLRSFKTTKGGSIDNAVQWDDFTKSDFDAMRDAAKEFGKQIKAKFPSAKIEILLPGTSTIE